MVYKMFHQPVFYRHNANGYQYLNDDESDSEDYDDDDYSSDDNSDIDIQGGTVQSVLFDTNSFNQVEAKEWLNQHGYIPIKFESTPNYLRYRLQDPHQFERIRTIKTNDGVDLLIGFY